MLHNHPPSHRRLPTARGFTLIELLVVIGIITVLLSILIPVVSAVRTTGYVSRTDARILALTAAIENYQQVFGAYPGPLADNQIQPATATGTTTSTENLSLGLVGGIQRNASTGVIAYDPTFVGQGPASLNPLKPKQYAAFIDPIVGGLDTQKDTATPAQWLLWSDPNRGEVSYATLYKDSVVPEFVDGFPSPMPILYIRARVGATGVIPGWPVLPPPAPPTTPAYDPAQLAPYVFPTPAVATVAASINNNKYTGEDPAVSKDFANPSDYFCVPGNVNAPRQKDGFLLISAGADRKYMTGDDRFNGGAAK
jgi:prepilin-type N-terminal cleavage/methylation domain-containing protein